ncbi:hypothetical protein HanIR_Chr06g0299061 [Helianthus annuus]|nr:hypothetical protein HanIR_Chr06g0299061 [Helianthus annuus]
MITPRASAAERGVTLRTVSDGQPAVVGTDGPMSIINMHRFPLCA